MRGTRALLCLAGAVGSAGLLNAGLAAHARTPARLPHIRAVAESPVPEAESPTAATRKQKRDELIKMRKAAEFEAKMRAAGEFEATGNGA